MENFYSFIVYRYNSTTGTFTVPPGGDGFYYFSVYLTVVWHKSGMFDIRINRERICTAFGETDTSRVADTVHTSCSATTYVSEGKMITHLMFKEPSPEPRCLCVHQTYVRGLFSA